MLMQACVKYIIEIIKNTENMYELISKVNVIVSINWLMIKIYYLHPKTF